MASAPAFAPFEQDLLEDLPFVERRASHQMPNDAPRWRVMGEQVLVETSSNIAAPAFSPDGRWLAYVSLDESGRSQVFVRPFPGTVGPWQISVDGGSFPVWSKVRSELYFGAPDAESMQQRVEYLDDVERSETVCRHGSPHRRRGAVSRGRSVLEALK